MIKPWTGLQRESLDLCQFSKWMKKQNYMKILLKSFSQWQLYHTHVQCNRIYLNFSTIKSTFFDYNGIFYEGSARMDGCWSACNVTGGWNVKHWSVGTNPISCFSCPSSVLFSGRCDSSPAAALPLSPQSASESDQEDFLCNEINKNKNRAFAIVFME